MSTQRFLISVLLLGVWSTCPASANILTYTDPATFGSATGSDTFSSLTFAQSSLGNSTTNDGIAFSSGNAGLTGVLGSSFSGWPADSAVQMQDNNGAQSNTLSLTIPTGVVAIEFYFGSTTTDNGFTITVTDNSAGSYTHTWNINFNSPQYIGFVTDSSFATFTISTDVSADRLTLDDIQIGQAAPTPEIATLLMVATGLFFIRVAKRWVPRGQAA